MQGGGGSCRHSCVAAVKTVDARETHRRPRRLGAKQSSPFDALERRDNYNGGWAEIFERRFKAFADQAI